MHKNLFQPYRPRILSEAEVEIIISGERKAVDRHIIFSLNLLAEAHERTLSMIEKHQEKEEGLITSIENIGGIGAITSRANYVDSMIERRKVRIAMMRKVAESSVTWALLLFFAFLASAVWNDVVRCLRELIHK